MHNESEIDRPIVERRAEPRLLKYDKRNHPAKQIIGDKDARPMKRNRLRSDTCLMSTHEPKIVKHGLEMRIGVEP